jgi:hypothetical protein
MPTAARLNQVIGILAKEEADYGTAETLSNSADGINPYIGDGDPAAPEALEYVFDGNIGRASSTLAPQRRTTPNGRFRTGQLQVLPKGFGSAYTGSVFPPREVHRMLKASGLDATYSASPTAQWTYTPTAQGTTFTSLTLRQFAQGMQFDQAGVLCDWSFETQGLGVPVWTFNWRGVATLPADQSLPAITIDSTSVIPPVASAVVANIGAFTTATIRRVAFRLNRNLETARVAQNLSGGHAGFVPGGMAPELEIEIERPTLATFNAESELASATSRAVDVTFGATQYNRWKLTLPQAQLASVAPGNDGSLATVVLTYRAFASTPTANDHLSLLFN